MAEQIICVFLKNSLKEFTKKLEKYSNQLGSVRDIDELNYKQALRIIENCKSKTSILPLELKYEVMFSFFDIVLPVFEKALKTPREKYTSERFYKDYQLQTEHLSKYFDSRRENGSSIVDKIDESFILEEIGNLENKFPHMIIHEVRQIIPLPQRQ